MGSSKMKLLFLLGSSLVVISGNYYEGVRACVDTVDCGFTQCCKFGVCTDCNGMNQLQGKGGKHGYGGFLQGKGGKHGYGGYGGYGGYFQGKGGKHGFMQSGFRAGCMSYMDCPRVGGSHMCCIHGHCTTIC